MYTLDSYCLKKYLLTVDLRKDTGLDASFST